MVRSPGLTAFWVLPAHSIQLFPALCMIVVSFAFKMHRPELMEQFSTEATYFTVYTQYFPCLYNPELCLTCIYLQSFRGLLQQIDWRNHEHHLFGYDTEYDMSRLTVFWKSMNLSSKLQLSAWFCIPGRKQGSASSLLLLRDPI